MLTIKPQGYALKKIFVNSPVYLEYINISFLGKFNMKISLKKLCRVADLC